MSKIDLHNNKKLSIVFLNFNRLHETRQTVDQLLKLCGRRTDIEIIAVDNGSNDGTAEFLASQENIQAILLDVNYGIAGYNAGFKQAKGDYILVLDDDSCPKDASTLNQIIDVFDQQPAIGVIACHIETPMGEAQWSWHLPPQPVAGSSPFFIGCGFAIRRNLFQEIGWYPEEFFLYQNEVEVAYQVRQRHFQIFYLPDCRVVHRGMPCQRPGWRRIYFPTRNTIWLIKRYYPQPKSTYMIISRMTIGLIRSLQFGEFITYLRAVFDAYKQPVKKQQLSPEILKETSVFFRQNSIFHHLFKRA